MKKIFVVVLVNPAHSVVLCLLFMGNHNIFDDPY